MTALQQDPPVSVPSVPIAPRWDIFCVVVDNYGDIGVCWRLARQLVSEHGIAVRLWVDDFKSAQRLIPSLNLQDCCQQVAGVEIRLWSEPLPAVLPGDVVIAAFACTLPDVFLEAMAARSRPPRWINLEYLSAEDWVSGCHCLPSPHPRLPLTQHFFFPGLAPGTGGLLREADYAARRAAFSPEEFWDAFELDPPLPEELRISLFSYENAGLAALFSAWSRSSSPVTCLVPEGRALPELAALFGVSGLRAGDRLIRNSLTLRVLPFVEQARYDELLWACNLNFVRGEDSFVRAQWAAAPFVWHIYAQQDDAHLEKLDAFLRPFRAGLAPEVARAVTAFWFAWNRGEGVEDAWPAFRAALPALDDHGPVWAKALRQVEDLAAQLVQFSKVEIE